MKYRCPVCHKIIKAPSQKATEEIKIFPFCSQRCRMIDLGAWLDGKYKVISELKSHEHTESPDASTDVPGQEQ